MKTKIIKLVIAQFFFCGALDAQIPNSDFENWYNVGGWFDNPDYWNTNNSQVVTTVVRPDSDAYSGMLAMLLYNNGIMRPSAITKFPASGNVNSMVGYVKLKLILNDTVMITLRELSNGIVVDSGRWIGLSDILNYTQITIPVTQNNNSIDTVEIEITGGNKNNLIFEGTSFLVDHLQLNQPSVVIECPVFDDAFAAYPNPVSDFITMKKNIITSKIEIIDSKGVIVKQIIPDQFDVNQLDFYQVNVASLATGIYYVQLFTKSGIKSCKFIKQ
jgi:hypothetical protein